MEGEIKKLWSEVGEATSINGATPEGSLYKGKKGFGLMMYGNKGETVRRAGNTSIRTLMADERCIPAVLSLLRSTGCGKLKEGVVLTRGTS